MSLINDKIFIQKISSYLDGFESKGSKFVCRCPYCGDSATDKHKKRGAFVPMEDSYAFVCKNCGQGANLSQFLSFHFPNVAGEYNLSRLHEQSSWDAFLPIKDEPILQIPETKSVESILSDQSNDWMEQFAPKTPLEEFQKIVELPPNHPGRIYLENRGVHGHNLHRFLWTNNFDSWCAFHTGSKQKFKTDPRIVAPLITETGIEIGAQGRTIIEESPRLRYRTASLYKDSTLAFGADCCDFYSEIWVTEGVFDSLAFPNSLAALHGDLGKFASQYRLPKSTVLVFDNEPGNREVRNDLLKAIKDGYRIAFWKYSQHEVGKDSATAILEKGLKVEEIFSVFSGIQAELEFARWAGCLS